MKNADGSFTIEPFVMGTEKESALKPLEEAAEVFALPPDRDTLKLMQSIESAIMAADVILEKLDKGVDDDEE